ncbi:unnamed protein product [Musa acuminata subsp. malaccensis]|uniref:(wild Malaysian banana) hypothetical protein n=1 Tax=Musa acuminata subsp. malaccensis TaxID=214687 RepID=A0A804I8N7_MUSAM|nr:PREDICTED: uncharacterized protein LOC103976852 [Musa acuminata subsp. malaccensis]CAG1849226.1 unnamed protein product [Musa acuminata subsp. malaccensis]
MSTAAAVEASSMPRKRFSGLRGVRWRIDLGILPCSPSASIDDLRRVTADTRRRYASLRRRLLIDHHPPKDGDASPDLTVDNPLSQNPDSNWGRFFRNAELRKMVDQDLTRLYPEHHGYFQTPLCQAMLRRILSLWCLQHPEYGYRQGMHELLAPIVYVLHADLDHLLQVQKPYEDCFNDEFDGITSPENNLFSNYKVKRASDWDSGIETENTHHIMSDGHSLDEIDPDTRDILLLSDSYGAEGELGVILSKKFMEHDAYCMLDNLMDGAQGVVAMASFFSPVVGSSTNLPPVIEASSALYHLLSIVDPFLHAHLVELEVEPQYFALRWLRVLFGREFCLEDVLVIWDEMFSSSNCRLIGDDVEYNFKVLCSPRGAFIAALAVSMLLYLRSSLLATETATTCLQRLLNFPQNPDTKKLIEKAKSFQELALVSNIVPSSSQRDSNKGRFRVSSGYSLPSGSAFPVPPLHVVPDSYWEEKWRVLHKDEELGEQSNSDQGSAKKKLAEKLSLYRTKSEPLKAKSALNQSSIRQILFDDVSSDIGAVENHVTSECCEAPINSNNLNVGDFPVVLADQRSSDWIGDETLLSGDNSVVVSKFVYPHDIGNEHEIDSVKSSVTSNSFLSDNDEETFNMEEPCSQNVSNELAQDAEATSSHIADAVPEQRETPIHWKSFAGIFQWFWKFGRGSNEASRESQSSSDARHTNKDSFDTTTCEGTDNSCGVNKRIEVGDKKMIHTLRNLGQSMLENIQVIETVFQQEKGKFDSLDNLSNNILGVKGQSTAITALKELRKVSNLLQEM